MIRRDYLMRMVQEMAQVLIRAVSLRHRQEYDQALRELGDALRQVREGEANSAADLSVEGWIALCRKHEQSAPAVMLAIADLLGEQGEVQALKGRSTESHRSHALGLGLYLEALLGGGAFVSSELISKVEGLAEQIPLGALDAGVVKRLMEYFVVRGRFAKAEDVLFSWMETGDSAARSEGLAFYEKLGALTDADLEDGGLPRAEVEQGRHDIGKMISLPSSNHRLPPAEHLPPKGSLAKD